MTTRTLSGSPGISQKITPSRYFSISDWANTPMQLKAWVRLWHSLGCLILLTCRSTFSFFFVLLFPRLPLTFSLFWKIITYALIYEVGLTLPFPWNNVCHWMTKFIGNSHSYLSGLIVAKHEFLGYKFVLLFGTFLKSLTARKWPSINCF